MIIVIGMFVKGKTLAPAQLPSIFAGGNERQVAPKWASILRHRPAVTRMQMAEIDDYGTMMMSWEAVFAFTEVFQEGPKFC